MFNFIKFYSLECVGYLNVANGRKSLLDCFQTYAQLLIQKYLKLTFEPCKLQPVSLFKWCKIQSLTMCVQSYLIFSFSSYSYSVNLYPDNCPRGKFPPARLRLVFGLWLGLELGLVGNFPRGQLS